VLPHDPNAVQVRRCLFHFINMTDRGLKWRTVATPSGGTQSNHAPRIPEAEWETHKPAIVDMYMTNNWPLTQVKEQMQKAPHNFSAT